MSDTSPRSSPISGVEAMWRCTACGKWSHAARQPHRHQRFIPRDEAPTGVEVGDEITGCQIFREEGEWPGTEFEDGHPGGFWVWCGPFDVWAAHRVPEVAT